MLLVLLFALAGEPVQVVLRANPRNAAAPPERIDVTLKPVGAGNDAKNVTLTHGGATLALPRGSVWEINLDGDGWWAPPSSITAGAATAFDIWRTAQVRGRVAVERGVGLPNEIAMSVESSFARGSSSPCDVGDDGTFSCEVPATTLDLAVRAKGFAPMYRWDVDVAAKTPHDLGVLALKKGGSLVAWLDRDSAAALAAPARARLVRLNASIPSATAARLSVPVAEGEFAKRGHVQLTGIPGGTYALEVVAQGFAKTTLSPIEVYDGKETAFRMPIELQRPVSVSLRVEPPQDADGKPWRVQVQRRSDFTQSGEPRAMTTTDAAGIVRIADQSAGRFRVEIEDGAGNRVFSDVIAFHGEPAEAHTIEVKQIRVTGKVTLGGKGIEAEVWFGGRDGATRVMKRSDAEGRFSLVLPSAGAWFVETYAVPDVEVGEVIEIDADGEDIAIELPDTTISGWVVDPDGLRVPRAGVAIKPAASRTGTIIEADKSGEFRIRGVRAGAVSLVASGPSEARSQPVTIQVPANGEIRGVELRLSEAREVQGQVLVSGRPAAGVLIDVVMSRTISDLDGRFTLKLPHGSSMPMTVAAPGRTFNTFPLPTATEPLRLDIPPVGGEVVVTLPGNTQAFQLHQNQLPVFFNSLRQWVMSHGLALPVASRVVLPNMAPGHYRACIGPQAKPQCEEGTLGPAGTLTLRLE